MPQFKKLLVKTFGGVLWRLERLLGNFPPTYLLVVIDDFLSQSLFLLWLHFGIWLVRLQQQFLELIDSVLFVIDLFSNVLPLKSVYVLSVCELVAFGHQLKSLFKLTVHRLLFRTVNRLCLHPLWLTFLFSICKIKKIIFLVPSLCVRLIQHSNCLNTDFFIFQRLCIYVNTILEVYLSQSRPLKQLLELFNEQLVPNINEIILIFLLDQELSNRSFFLLVVNVVVRLHGNLHGWFQVKKIQTQDVLLCLWQLIFNLWCYHWRDSIYQFLRWLAVVVSIIQQHLLFFKYLVLFEADVLNDVHFLVILMVWHLYIVVFLITIWVLLPHLSYVKTPYLNSFGCPEAIVCGEFLAGFEITLWSWFYLLPLLTVLRVIGQINLSTT